MPRRAVLYWAADKGARHVQHSVQERIAACAAGRDGLGGMTRPPNEPAHPERRRAARRLTHRPALVAPLEPGSLLHRGMAADISLSGLCVHTRTPEPPGTPVEVEMPPGSDGDGGPILVRGRVVRSRPLAGGLHAMGIHLAVPCASVPPVDVVSAPAQAAARRLISRVAEQMRGLHRDAPSPLAVLEDARQRAAPPAPEPRPERDARRQRRAMAVLALLFLLLGWLVSRVVLDPAVTLAEHRGSLGTWLEEASTAVPEEDAGATLVSVVAGRPDSAPVMAKAPPRWTGPDFGALPPPGAMLDGILPPFARPDPDAPAGEHGGAGSRPVDGVLRGGDSLPEPWKSLPGNEMGVPVEPGLPAPDGAGVAKAEHTGMGGPDARFAGIPLALVVHTREHRLTVYRHGAPVHAFPVGLGEDGATPQGMFRIANMITDPDWYNRGETVPAGDPRNPLGRHWMGLGGENGATSYGIHPTEEPDSIGANRSRGCIRMRPADAAYLFELCETGTPVLIEP